jgi:Spo0E like sporulation regulatory protein
LRFPKQDWEVDYVESKRLLEEIELLKQRLNELIAEKESLQDDEVIEASSLLDAALNEYNKLYKK